MGEGAPDMQFKSPLGQSTMDNICGGQKTQLLYLVIEMTLSKTSFMPLYPLYPIYPFPPQDANNLNRAYKSAILASSTQGKFESHEISFLLGSVDFGIPPTQCGILIYRLYHNFSVKKPWRLLEKL